MYNKVECITLTCDNCGETYREEHNGWSLFLVESDAHDNADTDEWYLGHLDGEHKGKHYCTDCFKYHETEDDVIIVDTSRKVNPSNT